MAHLAPPPPNINLQETKRPRMVAVFAGTWALGVLATLLRLYCRRLTKSRLWLDDWLIIISLFFSAAFMFDVTVWMASHGFGRHVWVGPPDALEVWAKGLFMAVFTYTLSLVFIKWSILAWYWRLFHIQSYMKPLIWILFAVVCIWGVAKIIVVSLECFPIEAIWEVFDPDNPLDPSEYHCGVDIHKFFLGNAIPNIITDIFIMVLPLPYILKLHLRVSQKVALFGIFVVGTFVTIVSAIRLVFVVGLDLHSPDKTWNQAEEMMWTGVEVNIATVCANLLTLRPILNLILHGTVYVESQQHSEALNVHIGGPDSTSKGHFHLILPKRALTREGRAERPAVSKKGSTSSTQPFVQHNEFGYSHSDPQQDMEATSMGSPGVGLSESGEGRGRSSLGPDLEAPPVGVEVVDTSEEGRWF